MKNQVVSCNGGVIRITSNLSIALRQVRFTDRIRTLWVDSICINQTDATEREHQVSMMGEIYKTSRCTLICIGSTGHVHAPVVADLVANVDSMIQSVFRRNDFSWCAKSFPYPDKDEPLLTHHGWDSFGVILQNPWFRRGWVVQEAAVSPGALGLWAGSVIDWDKIVQTYFWAIIRAHKLPSIQNLWMSDLHLEGYYTRRNREAVTFRSHGALQPPTFLESLDCARWLEFSDPRDRIFAFLGRLRANELCAFQPSYGKPCIDIYRDFACEYSRLNQDLDLLHFVHNDNSMLESEVASWIPRWDVRRYSSYVGTLNNYNEFSRRILSPQSCPKMIVSEDQTTLELRGILLDVVTFTEPVFDKSSTTVNDVISLWETVSKIPKPVPYSCTPLQVFMEIFCCGDYRGLLKEWEKYRSAYAQLIQRELSCGDASYDNAEKFHSSRMEDVHNKRFIITNRGYYGLAPDPVREGDVCCMICGTRSPFILRRTEKLRHFKLVRSTLILSKHLDHNGYPEPFGMTDDCEDWTDWGLCEEDIFLC